MAPAGGAAGVHPAAVGVRGRAGAGEGRVLPALLGTLGCLGLGVLGLLRAYRGTVRFYHGETSGRVAARVPAGATAGTTVAPARGRSRFLELRLPAVPEPAAALALATFRSMLRAPEVKMAWASSFIVTLIVGGSLLFRSTSALPEVAKPFLATASAVFSVFMLVQFFANQFGFDRDGFRTLMLSPVDRRLMLLGKNLACAPVGAGFGLVLSGLISLRLHLPLPELAAIVFQLVTLLLLAGLVGNLLSILVPYRIQAGSLKPTKLPGLAMLVMFLCHLLFPLTMTPVFLSPLAELVWRRAGLPARCRSILFSPSCSRRWRRFCTGRRWPRWAGCCAGAKPEFWRSSRWKWNSGKHRARRHFPESAAAICQAPARKFIQNFCLRKSRPGVM